MFHVDSCSIWKISSYFFHSSIIPQGALLLFFRTIRLPGSARLPKAAFRAARLHHRAQSALSHHTPRLEPAPRYSALLAGWCVLLSSKAGAAFGLRLGWLALFSPKAAEADQAGFLPALTRARDATAAVLLVSAPAHCTCWPCLAWRHPCSSLWRCLSWHSQAEGKAAAV